MIELFWVVIGLISFTFGGDQSPYHNILIEHACDTATSLLLPWTGFRISRQRVRIVPEGVHQMRFSYCWRGTEYSSTVWNQPGDSWISWNYIFCLEDNPVVSEVTGCYKIARRKRYASVESPLFSPDTFVGGLFQCESADTCSNEKAIPIAPLIADQPYMVWYENYPNYTEIVPFLYTPDRSSIFYPRTDTRWSSYIDVNEDYEEDDEDVDLNTEPGEMLVTPGEIYQKAVNRAIIELIMLKARRNKSQNFILARGACLVDKLLEIVYKLPYDEARKYHIRAIQAFQDYYYYRK